MSTVPIFADENWSMPSRGRVGMLSLIIGESAIFTIFVVAYVYYIGRSVTGPTPQILSVPIFNTVCLLSSSVTIWLAEHAIEHGRVRAFGRWWALTMLLGMVFSPAPRKSGRDLSSTKDSPFAPICLVRLSTRLWVCTRRTLS